ncbi:MAG TPA: DUF72 domain-containing protein [Chthoniobacterales bacterium]|nr:DUF72 domain-containing protein [Chthoniobacterales bacterium]
MRPGKIYIGTSGWMYKSWANSFYPKGCPAKRHLDFYVTQFPTVEINATFYRLPPETAFEAWYGSAPPGFLYAVKGSRAVTHFKRLKPGAKSFQLLLDRSRLLRSRLGPFLWQLPPNFPKNTERLTEFLKTLPRRFAHAIEFRHPSWLEKEVGQILKHYQVANVAVSSQAMPMHWEVTADFVYVRFHGLKGGSAHDYTDRELEPWAEHLRRCARQGVKGFVYFNNDVNTRAPLNALRLMEMVGKYAVRPGGGRCRGGGR